MSSRKFRISLANPDPEMPRTVYWEKFCAALRANRRFIKDASKADLLFPAEDIALETNWPRFGNPESAFVRGRHDGKQWEIYINRFAELPKAVCIVNMHPFLRVPRMVQPMRNVYVADISLAGWERSLNPRTISMPALPIVVGTPDAEGPRPRLGSFRGVMSHPCRAVLKQIHNGSRFVCEIVERANHVGRIDSERGVIDTRYSTVMQASEFAFVPRGDALFSYRLLEAVSFGCIPVILSDGWVLPFDRTIDWDAMALQVPEAMVPELPRILESFDRSRIADMRANLVRAWNEHFERLELIVETLLGELEALLQIANRPIPSGTSR
jgi:hypothetical protein